MTDETRRRLAALTPEQRQRLAAKLGKRTAPAETGIPRQDRAAADFPLSFAQHRMWFLDQLEPGSALYNNPLALQLDGDLNLTALESALGEVVRRHEVLRSTISASNGSPRQRVGAARSMPMRYVDLRDLPGERRVSEQRRLVEEEIRRPFDLAQGPLVRATLIRTGARQHGLVLTLHHVVSDGWSVGVLNAEVAQLYAAFCEGAPSPIPELAVQYADFAAWQRERLAGPRLEAQVAYWKDRLDGAPQALDIPTDRPRPPKRSVRGGRHGMALQAPLTRSLAELSQSEGATLFMTLMSAYQALLHRWSGQDDIVVGTPIAGRDRTELEPLIGFFVSTSVIRARMEGDPPFRDLLQQVKDEALGAYAHQEVPFEKLVDELSVERDPSRTPLFQVSFVMQNYAPSKTGLASGLTLSHMEKDQPTAEFDITLTMSGRGDTMWGEWEYRTDLFDPQTIERMSSHFTTLLEGIVADPGRRLSAYPLVGEGDTSEAVSAWNDTTVDYGPIRLTPQIFEGHAGRSADSIATVSDEGSLTYRELNARANRIARYLIGRGVGPDVPVGLHLERGPDLVAAVIGVLKAGGAYVPLDPEYPRERIDFLLQDSGIGIVVTSQRLAPGLPLPEDGLVRLDADWDEIARESAADPAPRAVPESLAYVIYTSGSTGRPKGTMIPHRGLTNYLEWATRRYSVTAGRGAVVHSPVGFDLTVTSLLCPLVVGGAVHLLPEDVGVDELGTALSRYPGMSLLKLTPSHLELLRHQLDPDAARDLARVLVVGGEALKSNAVDFWKEHAPLTRIVNEYGPTETVVGCCVFEFEAANPPAGDVPIGRPIANTRLYVRDGQGRLVPSGLLGELYIGGTGVTRGYLARPALTAEKFVPDPYGGEPGARLYRTGDVVRMRPDDELDFLGRSDDQVKIRGFRIELGEVGAALEGHAAVRQAAVVDREDHMGARQLVAYVVAVSGAEPSDAELRTHLLQGLPDYMVPAHFVALDALPLTANGKLDRKKLPEPDRSGATDDGGFVAPGTPLEELVAGIWEDVLAIDRVGAHDDFFQLGGHSLLATQLLSRIRQTCQIELPLAALFDAPTVAGLAQRVAEAMRAETGDTVPPIVHQGDGDRSALSFAQQRLWLLDQMTPANPSYNVVSALRLDGRLNREAFGHAVSEIIRRHEVLRVTFTESDGRPSQVIQPAAPVPVTFADVSSGDAEVEETLIARLVAEESTRPFHLASGPMLRVTLIRAGRDEHVVVLSTHHIVCDGWSMGVLVSEFSALYQSFSAGRPSSLPELRIQYGDFARWQLDWMDGQVLESQLGYWRQRLGGGPPRLAVPTDRERPAVETSRGAVHTMTLPAELSAKLRALSRGEGVTLFMTMLAALQVQFHKYTGQDDILIGTDSAGRNRLETEGLIGFFINLLVLRTDLNGDPPFRTVMHQVRERALEAYAHQDLPFEKLVEELAPERSLNDTPLFQVLFVFQNTPVKAMAISELSLRAVEMPATTSKFDLALFVTEGEHEIGVTWQYKTDLFDTATIERLARHYGVLLESVVEDPNEAIHDLRMVTQSVSRRPRRARAQQIDL